MHTFAPLTDTATDTALPLHVIDGGIDSGGLNTFLDTCTDAQARWINGAGFVPNLGKTLMVPNPDGSPAMALVGYGTKAARRRLRFGLAGARAALPCGTYQLITDLSGHALDEVALGWLLAGYHFDRYRQSAKPMAQLIAPQGVDAARLQAIAAGEFLTRTLINTPANDMGPEDLEAAVRDVANQFGAQVNVTKGDDLLSENFPMIHAVGRAAAQPPRLIDMRWGDDTAPTLTLVGKGVCFDTGGLNLKPGAAMGLMKKDMGGAAAVLGLAQMIMTLDLPLRLRVLIPAVENAVSANAMRPGDILASRKGLSVEINNTDAEGRLVLADALALADEENPDLIISMATLTGAARVAVGPDLAPFFTTSKKLSKTLKKSAKKVSDPIWQLPYWDPYETMIEPGIADLDNAPKGGFAGTITAALFLRRFVTDTPNYAHFDIYGWQPAAAPARPKGGMGQATRTILAALPKLLNL